MVPKCLSQWDFQAAIQPNIQIGDPLIPLEAIRDEGTSYHYIPRNLKAIPTKSILEALKRACRSFGAKYHVGSVWITDASYRETKSKVRRFQADGVLRVDIETSAVYSLAIYRKVRVGCILIASDNLVTLTSTKGLETPGLKRAVEKDAEIAVETIKILSEVRS
ncbi:TPA: hypothetical protein EYP75_05650 [Candidatus Bathyarchaeota archaeon]|nr:hypothetical protein [Candidatus Bathyarchaeota archaeon]